MTLLYIFAPESKTSGWYSMIPSLFAIMFVFLIKNVVICLLSSVVIGSLMLIYFEKSEQLFEIFDKVILSHGNIEIFLMVACFLSFVSVMLTTGGFLVVAQNMQQRVKSKKMAQLFSAILGITIFIDGYANALIVGSMTRTLAIKYKISREKMAFIVDATSAPIAGIVIFSTWIAFEVGLFEQLNQSLGIGVSGISMFTQAMPYRFYCIFMILFVFINILVGREFGPMVKAETKILESDEKLEQITENISTEHKLSIYTAIIPLLTLIGVMGIGVIIFGMNNAMTSLFAASILTLIISIVLGVSISKFRNITLIKSALSGAKKSLLPILIIILAWILKSICNELGTGQYIIESFGNYFNPQIFPAIVFITASIIAFSIGTSWGTMSILIPLLIPLAYELDNNNFGQITILSLAAVLDGAVFGDHSSPISDTTILSSIATNCGHLGHVKTQVVYAIFVGLVALLCGYIMQSYGAPWILSLIIGIIIMVIACMLGKKTNA